MIIKKFFEKKILVFLIISLLFLFLTNNYFGPLNINNSAASSIYYLEIANSSPFTPKLNNTVQSYIHAERFLISYIIGLIGFIFNFDKFFIFQFFTYLLIFIFLFTCLKIIEKFNLNEKGKVFLLSLIIFNPYILRYFIANPVMINDLCFFISINLMLIGFQNQKNYIFYLGIVLSILSRQTFFVIYLAIIITFLLFIKKKTFLNKNKILIISLFLILNILLKNLYIDLINLTEFYSITFLGLLNFFKYNFNLLELFKFLFYPSFSFGPLFLLFFYLIITKNYKFSFDEKTIFYIFIILGIFAQPILAGPEVADKNIIRLSSFSYLPLMCLIFSNKDNRLFFNNIFNKSIMVFLIIWSFHPTFSISSKILQFVIG